MITGRNKRTGQVGDFPGSQYAEFMEEVKPSPVPPILSPAPSTLPPTPPPRIPKRNNPAVVSPTRKESFSPPYQPQQQQHDLFKVIIQIPIVCVVCKLNIINVLVCQSLPRLLLEIATHTHTTMILTAFKVTPCITI